MWAAFTAADGPKRGSSAFPCRARHFPQGGQAWLKAMFIGRVAGLNPDSRVELPIIPGNLSTTSQASTMAHRTVFFVSDGTGITAETFGNSILSQFAIKPRHVRRPFIDTVDKAHQVLREIHHSAATEGQRPVVFVTLVNPEILAIIKGDAAEALHKGLVLDMFNTFIEPLEAEFAMTSNHRVGRFADVSKSQEYTDRIDAINYSLAHDDGQSAKNLASADVILVGVSRSGKTPTSLYLAMQHGIKAANYPLIPEDFDRGQIPSTLAPYRKKCFGLTIDPERLSQIRNERRPDSKYAAVENCRREVREAEAMMRREGIAWLSSTHKSIEEIATTILRDLRPDRLMY
jgi:regulator of PEP synthase PpsR (kinase-PPPase family)